MNSRQTPMLAYKLTRSGTFSVQPQAFISSAGVFSSSITSGTTLLVSRDESGLSHYILVPEGNNAEQSATHLANAVTARADRTKMVPDLGDVNSIVWLTTEAKPELVSRDTQFGSDPASVARALAVSMRPGQWIAVVLRKPTQKERRWALTWLESQMNTANPQYHSRRADALVATFYAGAANADEAAQLLREAAAAMPGFDMATRHASSSRAQDSMPYFGGGVVAGGLGVLLSNPANLAIADLPGATPVVLFAGAAAALVWGGLTFIGRVRGAHARLLDGARDLRLPVARPLLIPPTSARKASVTAEKTVEARPGGYAFHRNGFLVGQEIPVSLVAPHAGAASGEMITAVREAPASMNNIIGPRIGTSANKWVALSAKDMWQGIMFVGVPGSGKSVALRNIWTWSCMERATPSGQPGFPGKHNAVIALETKGQGAAIYRHLAQSVGDNVGYSDLSDDSTPAIDLFPRVGSLDDQARTIVGAMKYLWGEHSIGSHSFNMLTRVFIGALIMNELGLAAQVPGLRQGASPWYYANILLGGYGDDAAVAVGSAILSEAARTNATEDTDLGKAALELQVLFGKGVTPSQRKTATEAPRNKAGKLLSAEGWWSRTNKVSWDQVLQGGWGIVVNVGSTAGVQVDDEMKKDMSALLMYSLSNAIKRNCIGWDKQGKQVSIFADELTEIAGTSPEIIEWMKDKGREFGVVPVFATQRAGQLETQVRESVMGFGTVLSYTQDHPTVMRDIVADLTADSSEWTTADVANLPPFEAIVRTRVNSVRQSPFTLKLTNFEADLSRYKHIQTTATSTDIR